MRKNSFTVLEVILAITVLTIAVSGSFILISQTIGSVSVIQSRLIASYLVQEGLELARNIRDSNWLNPDKVWDESLGAGDYEGDFLTTFLPSSLLCSPDCEYEHLSFLNIDENGFYSYSFGDPTIFKRKITISKEPEEPDRLKVSVEVLWKGRGQPYSLAAQEYLYNWNK